MDFFRKSLYPVRIPGEFEYWKFQKVEGKKYWKIPGGGESFDGVSGGTVSGHSQQGAWTISETVSYTHLTLPTKA